eukprot:364973-Chlamydomonas_euryale.AAC.4
MSVEERGSDRMHVKVWATSVEERGSDRMPVKVWATHHASAECGPCCHSTIKDENGWREQCWRRHACVEKTRCAHKWRKPRCQKCETARMIEEARAIR